MGDIAGDSGGQTPVQPQGVANRFDRRLSGQGREPSPYLGGMEYAYRGEDYAYDTRTYAYGCAYDTRMIRVGGYAYEVSTLWWGD